MFPGPDESVALLLGGAATGSGIVVAERFDAVVLKSRLSDLEDRTGRHQDGGMSPKQDLADRRLGKDTANAPHDLDV